MNDEIAHASVDEIAHASVLLGQFTHIASSKHSDISLILGYSNIIA